MKRLCVVLAVLFAAAFGLPQAASANVTGAGSKSVSGPKSRQLTSQGAFIAAVGSSTLTVSFECGATAMPDAVATSIRPPEENGCVLYRNGVKWITAEGRSLPGGAVVTTGMGDLPLIGNVDIRLCWRTYTTFTDGASLTSDECTVIGV